MKSQAPGPEAPRRDPRQVGSPSSGRPHEEFHRDLVEQRRTEEHDLRMRTDELGVPADGILLDPDYDEQERFGEEYDADEREESVAQAELLEDEGVIPPGEPEVDFVGGGRHPRGYDSKLDYQDNYGQQLGEGTWRSEDDQGMDRSGRAGFLRDDMEHVPNDPLSFEQASLDRVDDGRMGDTGSGLSNSPTWEPPVVRDRIPRRHLRSDATDEFIQQKVHEELSDHTEIDASNVEVGVVEGFVTLRGTVPDLESRNLAEELTRAVYGVREVKNLLALTG
ncbi:MAG: BON domain-containing protein [Myxococcota bacterium]